MCGYDLYESTAMIELIESEENFNLGWICAAINSFSCILFCVVYFKLCRIMFTKNRSRNWLTIYIYLLIILGLGVGCMAITSVVLQENVYKTSTLDNISMVS